jgi:nicotinate-nucleotide pyrophosphorylase (carboxylating)
MAEIALFDEFFQTEPRMFLLAGIRVALSEDGPDLTSNALFEDTDMLTAQIVAKSETVVCGLPLIPLILEFAGSAECQVHLNMDEGERASPGAVLAVIQGPAAVLLKAERVILNYVCHLSGVAHVTSQYVQALEGTPARLLDTRKTLPGLRYAEKYAVRVGGGTNHRLNLAQMLMLKDNHLDRAGSMAKAVEALRAAYDPCPPIEVECRSLEDVTEAVNLGVDRIMLDNMDAPTLRRALELVPEGIETEASGAVDLENVRAIGEAGPDYVSVGRITHSAPAADLSMQIVDI